jgi:hypothetical protein
MRRLILLLCLLTLTVGVPRLHAQAITDVFIMPTSGNPGTTVTIFNTNPSMSFQCFAATVDLGFIPAGGSLAYTIPLDATPDTFIDFRCYITNVDTTDSVGLFYVQPPIPPPTSVTDSDGDGILDSQDLCPFEFAQTPNGCPPIPTATLQGQPTIAPTVELFPSGTACTVSPSANATVNVREAPSTNATIVTEIAAGTSTPVLLMTEDRSWVQIASGWVSTSVTRLTGDCTAVPTISYQNSVIATPTRVPIPQYIAPQYDVGSLLSACPELVEMASGLNFQAILRLIGIRSDGERCALARTLLQYSTYRRAAIPPVNITTDFGGTCEGLLYIPPRLSREETASYGSFIRTVSSMDADFYQSWFSFDGRWRSLNQAGSGEYYCELLRLNRPRIGEAGTRLGMTYNELMTMAVATCSQAWTLPVERLRVTIIQLIRVGFDPVALLRDPQGCNLIHEANLIGTLTDVELRFFAVLVQTCQFTRFRQPIRYHFLEETMEASAVNIVAFAIRHAVDLSGCSNIGWMELGGVGCRSAHRCPTVKRPLHLYSTSIPRLSLDMAPH